MGNLYLQGESKKNWDLKNFEFRLRAIKMHQILILCIFFLHFGTFDLMILQ